jgi:hypothetical protein
MMRNLNVHEIMIGFLQKKLWMIEKIVEQDLEDRLQAADSAASERLLHFPDLLLQAKL